MEEHKKELKIGNTKLTIYSSLIDMNKNEEKMVYR